jgi:hypothetical protein
VSVGDEEVEEKPKNIEDIKKMADKSKKKKEQMVVEDSDDDEGMEGKS